MAAVSVVLPWSIWPIVPTLTCGFERSNFFLAMLSLPCSRAAPLGPTVFCASVRLFVRCFSAVLP